jgi:hypothetical protein
MNSLLYTASIKLHFLNDIFVPVKKFRSGFELWKVISNPTSPTVSDPNPIRILKGTPPYLIRPTLRARTSWGWTSVDGFPQSPQCCWGEFALHLNIDTVNIKAKIRIPTESGCGYGSEVWIRILKRKNGHLKIKKMQKFYVFRFPWTKTK